MTTCSWIADRISILGENRRPYVFICSVVSALCYIYTGLYCASIGSAFAVVFIRSVSEAFSEIMLGVETVFTIC